MPSKQHSTSVRLIGAQACTLLLLSMATGLLSGCGNFFSCEGKTACPATGTTGTTGTGGSAGSSTDDYIYVANSVTGDTYLNGYSVGSGTLVAATDSPFSLGYIPTSLAVTPADTFMYATSDSAISTGDIYGYSIGTGGALSVLDGKALISEDVTSIDISPDGQWLFCLDTDGITLEEYSINSSTGALTFAATYGITGATGGVVTPSSVRVAPSGDYVAVALGTGGAETFTFNTTTGVASPATLISPVNASTGIYAVAIDGSDYLYCAGTAGLQVFSATTTGIATPQDSYTTGSGANSVVITSASSYVYVGNEADSTITGYLIGTNAALTALAGSPYTAPTNVDALSRDSTSDYLIASGYNSTSGVQLFSIGSTGALTSVSSAGSGTSTAVPAAIAATH